MKYFLPDSQDLVDPSFEFDRERRSATRFRQTDDLYAHEVFRERAFDGLLVSKGIVYGSDNTGGRYTSSQRFRLLRSGVRAFFRLDSLVGEPLSTMGDCGAFTYVKEELPPYSVEKVLDFYLDCGFDYGISVDHVILAFNAAWDAKGADVPSEVCKRQAITLEFASEFIAKVRKGRLPFVPLGVAQGWSPRSYARAVEQLQKMGYRYIAVGGMVPLKTMEILASLEAINSVRRADTRLHLLGITRVEQMHAFARMGVASFDSTSPLRQAFKDEKNNYYTPTRTYVAVRIPQIEGNLKLQRRISSGEISQGKARELERMCLDVMRRLDAGSAGVEEALLAIRRYNEFCGNTSDYEEEYREVLTDRPWKECPCEVCRALGHHVILFRGAERNRRRGFHNTWIFYRNLQHEVLAFKLEKTVRGRSRTKRPSAAEIA